MNIMGWPAVVLSGRQAGWGGGGGGRVGVELCALGGGGRGSGRPMNIME